MKQLIEKLKSKEDRGSAIVLIAGSLVLLMGLAAFGVDLAWFYLNSSRVQRTADAASLAGVIHLPADESSAISDAFEVATQNGYDDSDDETTVVPDRISSNELQVTVSQDVPTFFLKVFGMNSQTITETATAEYIPPLKLGSPSNKFGNDPSCYGDDLDCEGNFWANIHGTRTDTGYGDAFSSYCTGGSSNGCSQNPDYRERGYLYGVIPGGSNVTIETLDMAYHYDDGEGHGDFHRTGDHDAHQDGTEPGQSVTVNVYAPDATPLDISDNTRVCSETYDPEPQVDPHDEQPFDYEEDWEDIGKGWQNTCNVNTSSAPNGVWIVQVVANSDGDRFTDLSEGDMDHSGLNRYSIRTNTGNIFALGDFSIYNNAAGTETNFYLAEVPEYYAGKTFVVEMFDTGESDDTGLLQPIDPTTGEIFDSGECRIYSRNIGETSWGTPDTTINAGNNCQESVSPQEYHARWLKFEMDLPAGYNCTDCWWRMNYDYPGTVNDTTTWRAYMVGNPIHLVP